MSNGSARYIRTCVKLGCVKSRFSCTIQHNRQKLSSKHIRHCYRPHYPNSIKSSHLFIFMLYTMIVGIHRMSLQKKKKKKKRIGDALNQDIYKNGDALNQGSVYWIMFEYKNP